MLGLRERRGRPLRTTLSFDSTDPIPPARCAFGCGRSRAPPLSAETRLVSMDLVGGVVPALFQSDQPHQCTSVLGRALALGFVRNEGKTRVIVIRDNNGARDSPATASLLTADGHMPPHARCGLGRQQVAGWASVERTRGQTNIGLDVGIPTLSALPAALRCRLSRTVRIDSRLVTTPFSREDSALTSIRAYLVSNLRRETERLPPGLVRKRGVSL